MLDEPEAYVNQPVTVHVGARFMRCDGGLDVTATATVRATVQDTTNAMLPLQITVRSQRYEDDDGGLEALFGSPFSGGTLVIADLTFTPTRLGVHHLTAGFQPSIGTLRAEVFSMIDGRGSAKTVDVPQACNWFDVWRGMPLCLWLDPDGGSTGTLWVGDEGHTLAQFKVLEVWPSDAGVWVVSPYGDLSLYRFSHDAGVEEPGTATLPSVILASGGSAPVLAADGDQLLLAGGYAALLAQPEPDGGLSLTDAGLFWTRFDPQWTAVLSAGEGALLAGTLVELNGPPTLYVVSFGDGGVNVLEGAGFAAIERKTVWETSSMSGAVSAVTLGPGPAPTIQPAPFVAALDFPPTFDNGPVPITDQTRFPFTLDAPSIGASQSAPLYTVSEHHVVRVPVLSTEPTLEGYGPWDDAPPTALMLSPPRPLSVSEGAVWQYLPARHQVRYLER